MKESGSGLKLVRIEWQRILECTHKWIKSLAADLKEDKTSQIAPTESLSVN